jgi:site-specific recombinase XerD
MIVAFEKYLTYNRRFAENTVKSYLFDIKLFLQFFAFKSEELVDGLATLQREDYRRYLAFRIQEKKIKASSNARAISSIKCFFNFLEKSDFLKNSNASQISFPKLPKLLPKALSEEEMKEFLLFLEEDIKLHGKKLGMQL